MSEGERKIGRGFVALWLAFVTRRHKLVLSMAVLSTLVASTYAGLTLKVHTDHTDMLSAEIPFRRNDIALRQAFPGIEAGLIAFVEAGEPGRAETAARALAEALRSRQDVFGDLRHPPSDPFFRRHALLYLSLEDLDDRLVRLAAAAPLLGSLRQNPSLGGYAELFERLFDNVDELDDPEQLRRFLEALDVTAERFAAGQHWPLSWQALLAENDVRRSDRHVAVILLYPKLDFTTLKPAAAAATAVRDAFEALPVENRAGARLHLSGSALMFQEELETLGRGMLFVGLAALAAVSGLLWLGLGSWRAVAALVLTLLVGLGWSAAFAGLAIGTLNLISVAFAVLFIGLGVDFGIHFFVRALDNPGSDISRRLRLAGERCASVLGLCALSSALAFFAFLPTDYRGLSELGLISGTAMFIALAATFTVLPAALLTFRWSNADGRRDGGKLAVAVLLVEGIARRHPWRVLSIAALAGLLSLSFLPWASFDDDPMNLRDPNSPAVAALKRFSGESHVEPYLGEIVLSDIGDARRLARNLQELDTVRAVRSLDDLVPEDQEEKLSLLSDLTLFLPPSLTERPSKAPPADAERRAELERLQRILTSPKNPYPTMGARLSEALDQFVDADRERLADLERLMIGDLHELVTDLRLSLEADSIAPDSLPDRHRDLWQARDGRLRLSVVPSQDLSDQAARNAFVRSLRSLMPEAGGIPVVIFEAGRAVIEAFAEALLYAVSAIFLLLWWRLRSALDAGLVLAPLALAGIVTVAMSAVLGWPFNFANVIVLPLLFGLGVDSGIHMVARARDLAGGPEEGRTLQAILLSSLTTIASFGALSFSAHPGTASMGRLLTLAIILGLTATLVVLPALLSLRGRLSAPPGQRQAESGTD